MMHHHGTYWTGCGPHARAAWEEAAPWVAAASGLFLGAAAFGVRRPLRFLAFQLGLDEAQTRELARVLDELKTERAQTSVDHRRMSAALAALLGPSGSGKTTLLRIIAGLEVPDGGSVRYDEQDVTDVGVRERNVGFVFQHYALFRHMSVFDNIAFGLSVRGWPRPRAHERVQKLLALIQLEGLERALPSQLSGGQRQRVALARALAAEPKV